jgi:hypothetical protein
MVVEDTLELVCGPCCRILRKRSVRCVKFAVQAKTEGRPSDEPPFERCCLRSHARWAEVVEPSYWRSGGGVRYGFTSRAWTVGKVISMSQTAVEGLSRSNRRNERNERSKGKNDGVWRYIHSS